MNAPTCNQLPIDKEIIGIDFFCGAGGITKGFLSAGIDVICGIDSDKSAQKTYEENNKRKCGEKSKFISEDIVTLDIETLEKEIGNRQDKILVFIGCAPCQPFTGLNTEKANQGDKKNLLLCLVKYIEHFAPEYLVFENVPGICSPKYGDVFQKFLGELERLEYQLDDGIIDAKNYGVPQRRRRMAIIASKLGAITLPAKTHGVGKLPYETAASSFRFPPIQAGEKYTGIPNHESSELSELNLRRIVAITQPGGSRSEWPDELQLECYKEHDGHTDVYGRINPDLPAPTLTTKFNSISNGRFGHPTENRAISIREGAALQTFPDDYEFHASISVNAKHHCTDDFFIQVFLRGLNRAMPH
jgi:DNA (cytosine-5)-methyltransferase 1